MAFPYLSPERNGQDAASQPGCISYQLISVEAMGFTISLRKTPLVGKAWSAQPLVLHQLA